MDGVNLIQDLHSHTYYSFCGGDKPEEIVEAAIAGGIELFGITDHNYGIGNGRMNVFNATFEAVSDDYERTLIRYYDHINLIKEKYADKIRILRGIEIATLFGRRYALPDSADISFFDYCLVENLDHFDTSIAGAIYLHLPSAVAARWELPIQICLLLLRSWVRNQKIILNAWLRNIFSGK